MKRLFLLLLFVKDQSLPNCLNFFNLSYFAFNELIGFQVIQHLILVLLFVHNLTISRQNL